MSLFPNTESNLLRFYKAKFPQTPLGKFAFERQTFNIIFLNYRIS